MTLKEAREAKRLSQKESAELIGTDEKTVSKWETQTHKPTFQNWRKLETVLETTIEFKER